MSDTNHNHRSNIEAWERHPVTIEYFNRLNAFIQVFKDNLWSGSVLQRPERTAIDTAVLIGKVQAVEVVAKLCVDQMKRDYDDTENT